MGAARWGVAAVGGVGVTHRLRRSTSARSAHSTGGAVRFHQL